MLSWDWEFSEGDLVYRYLVVPCIRIMQINYLLETERWWGWGQRGAEKRKTDREKVNIILVSKYVLNPKQHVMLYNRKTM